MGRFPVVSVSLKSVGADDYETARSLLIEAVGREARRLQFLLDSPRLSLEDKKMFSMLMENAMDDAGLFCSLYRLSELLRKHYGLKVIMLIDEYDVPLAKASERGYYERMVTLIRGMFDQALKTNDNLYFSVLTGCLRVAKESIFTGLNNPKIFSVTTARFDEYFGFTDGEVQGMLDYYGVENRYGAVKEWYDGYRFGNVDVYCPWDVINYCDDLIDDQKLTPKDYWSNTSGNEIVRHFLEQVNSGVTKSEVEALIARETVTKDIYEELTYNSLYGSIENLWSVLLAAGYLTMRGRPEGRSVCLAIPNMEIRNIFAGQIMAMFREETGKDGKLLESFCSALETGQAENVEELFNIYLSKTISIRDTFVRKPMKENFYHGILLGILGWKSGWDVRSNQKAGEGYSDIFIRIEDEAIGIVIEVKYAENKAYDSVCEGAIEQINRGRYTLELEEDGYGTILKYGIACFKKKCRVTVEKERGD